METLSDPLSLNGSASNARLRVLEMIDEGRITAEQGLHLLQAFSAQDMGFSSPKPEPAFVEEPQADFRVEPEAAAPVDAVSLQDDSRAQTAHKWRRWWMIPLWIGAAITAFGGLFMFLSIRSSGIGFWFVCASVPCVLGLVIIVLAWLSRSAPWLHVRVRQSPGQSPQRIAFSLPLPVKPAAWFLRHFSRWIPGMKEHGWGEVILTVGEKVNADNPLFIEVDEAETGEKVEVYIG